MKKPIAAIFMLFTFPVLPILSYAQVKEYIDGKTATVDFMTGVCADMSGKTIMGLAVIKEYYDDAENILKAENPCKNGKVEGSLKYYHESRDEIKKLWIETPYKNGKAAGISKIYDISGKLRSETPFKNNKQEGVSKNYRENSKMNSQSRIKAIRL